MITVSHTLETMATGFRTCRNLYRKRNREVNKESDWRKFALSYERQKSGKPATAGDALSESIRIDGGNVVLPAAHIYS